MASIEGFLRLMWPTTGVYCLAVKSGEFTRNETFTTIEAAAKRAAALASTKDVYFATHSLKQEKVWNPTKEKWQVRTQANAQCSKLLYFDLDVGPDDASKYPDQRSAILGFLRFVSDTGLPVPTFVSSGYGVHTYWILDRALDSESEWKPLAAKLRHAAEKAGVKFDSTVNVDSARVLRIHGTLNHKGGKTAPVAVIGRPSIAPAAQMLQLVDDISESFEYVAAAPDELGSNTTIAFDGPPVTMMSLIQACPQIERIARAKGKDSHEPEWYTTLGIVYYTDKGREGVHKISSGHSGYDQELTDAKLDQWLANATGPSTCANFRVKVNSEHRRICDACPHLVKKSTPLHVARLLAHSDPPKVVIDTGDETVEEVEVKPPPPPFKFGPTGAVEMIMEDKEGKEYVKTIYPYRFYPVIRSSSGDTEYHLWRLHLPHEKVREFRILAKTFGNDLELRKYLMDHGIYPPNDDFPLLRRFMSAYIQSLIKQQAATQQYDHLGWINNRTEIIVPGAIYAPGGIVKHGTLSDEAAYTKSFIYPQGSKDAQLECLSFWDDPFYDDHKFYICAGLAAPLIWMTHYDGVLVNAYGNTGRGKSFALEMVCSVFGNPKKYLLNGKKEGATFLGKSVRRNMLGNLPVAFDEMTNLSTQEIEDVVLGATHSGKRQTAINQIAENISQENIERSTVILCTSNTSFYEKLGGAAALGGAGLARVWEMEFPMVNIGPHTVAEADDIRSKMYSNFGHLGARYLRILVEHRDKIQGRVKTIWDELKTLGRIRPQERYWFIVGCTAICVCSLWRKLGWISWDPTVLQDRFLNLYLPRNRGIVVTELSQRSPIATLASFLDAHSGNVLATEVAGDYNLIVKPIYGGGLFGHIDLTNKLMLVSREAFGNYCRKEGRPVHSILENLSAKGVITQLHTRRTLGWNTEHQKTRTFCFEVDLAHPDIADVMSTTFGLGNNIK